MNTYIPAQTGPFRLSKKVVSFFHADTGRYPTTPDGICRAQVDLDELCKTLAFVVIQDNGQMQFRGHGYKVIVSPSIDAGSWPIVVTLARL